VGQASSDGRRHHLPEATQEALKLDGSFPALGLQHYMINFRGEPVHRGPFDLAPMAVPGQHLRPQPPPSGRVSRGPRRASDHDQQHGRGPAPDACAAGKEWGPDDTEAVREVVAVQSANSTPHQEREAP
jgi:hypothetical protein